MTVTDILEKLRRLEIRLWVDDGGLKFRSPKGRMTPELRDLLQRNKPELIERLRGLSGEDKGRYPLSYNQQSLWFFYQMAPDSSCYNVSLSCRIVSAIHPDAMCEACRKLIKRHEILRTTYGFGDHDGQSVQTIHGEMEPDFYLIDASGLSDTAVKSKVKAAHSRPFDLENGPVLRLCLFQRSGHEHIFLMTIHHIACDGSSFGMLLDDFKQLYRAELAGEDAGLPDVQWHYRDFVRFQGELLQGKEGTRLGGFWRGQLSGSLPVMSLPLDYERPAIQCFTGASYPFQLAGPAYEALLDFTKNENVTRYVFLLAVFQVTLMRCCNQEEIIVGTPAVGRSHSEFKGVCGHFINMVAMRGELSGEMTFRDHLQRSRRVVLQALDHQAYPFLLVVESLGIQREPSRSPVFQVMFNMLNRKILGPAADFFMGASHDTPVDFGGLKIMPYPVDQEEGQFELILEIMDTDESLVCALKYRTDLFKEETVASIAETFQCCLQQFMEDPEMRLEDLQLPCGMSWETPVPGVPWRAGEAVDEQGRIKRYWMNQLAGDLPVLQLPVDYPRPAEPEYRCGTLCFGVSAEHTAALKKRSKREGITEAALLLSAYTVLLSRYSGQKNMVVGVPYAASEYCDTEGLGGPFRYILPLRVALAESCTFDGLSRLLCEMSHEAMAHKGVPFRQLVESLELEAASDHHPLFQAMFAFEDFPLSGASGSSQTFHPGGEGEGPGCDLSLFIWEEESQWQGAFLYNEELFTNATVGRMQESFEVLIEEIAKGGNGPLDRMPLLSRTEREKLIDGWNDTGRDYPAHVCLHELFDVQVEKTPDAVAVVFENSALTYRELSQRANRLAHYLRKLGVGPEKRVGIFMERSMEMIVALYGTLKAGGAYVPLDPDYPAERVAYMLEDTDVPVLLTQAHLKAEVPDHSATVICLDTQWERVAQESAENPVTGVSADNLAYVIYTSGSTGTPKGVMNSHRGICNRLYWMQEAYRLTGSDRVLQKTPYSFDVSVWEFFWPLLFGARLVVAPPGIHKDPVSLGRLIHDQGITTLHFVPSMMQLFLRENHDGMCRSLKKVVCSGEALSCELQEHFFEKLDAELHNLYGPTEAAVDVTFWECRRGSQRLTVPIGKPVANTQIYILDRYMQPVPVGVAGELHIGGVQVARGYLNRPELTEEKFVPDPFRNEPGACLYKTGDLARYLPDGNVEYLGRNDFQVKVRGLRIELGEIEAVICRHPDILETVVVARDDASGNKQIVAYVVAASGVAVVAGALRDFLSETLPGFMIPSFFLQMEALPLMENGKVNRKALPGPTFGRPETGTPYTAPVTETEKVIAEIWQALLGVDCVGIDDNFFEVGGDSLLLVQVANQLAGRVSADLKVHHLFEYPTIRAVAGFLDPTSDQPAVGGDMDARLRKRKETLSKRKKTRRGVLT